MRLKCIVILVLSLSLSACIDQQKEKNPPFYKLYYKDCPYAYTYGDDEDVICELNMSHADAKLENGLWQLYFDKALEHNALEFTIQQNVLNGIRKQWDFQGNLIEQSTYKDGKLNGERLTWFEKGTMRYKGHYLKGKKTGEHFLWDKNGDLKCITDYQDGIKKQETYFKDERKQYTYLYKNNPERMHLLLTFDTSGFLKSSHRCQYDTIVDKDSQEEIIRVQIESLDIDSLNDVKD